MSAFGVNPHSMNSGPKGGPRHMNGNAGGFSDSRKSGNGGAARKHHGEKGNKGAGKGQAKSSNKPKKSESPVTDDPGLPPPKVMGRQAPEKLQDYSPLEIQQGGPVFSNPQALGFQQSRGVSERRPVPKYLIHQSRLLYTPAFVVNAWDKQNQDKMLQMEQANSGSDYQGIYEEFQKMREAERSKMEHLGLVDAMDIRKDLNDAISFQGSCEDMCPIFERVRRSLENNVKSLEKDPSTNRISRTKAVKAFSRPAAGQPPPLPSEVRPPHILKKTLDYLVDNIVDKLPEAHSFIWDRTRSIRQDFTYQNSFGPEAIDCNERIVRIHLLSLHVMANSKQEYSQQQELEQFNKALQTLIEIYQDIRNHGGGNSPNEAEFRSYYLLSHLRNPELDQEIQALPMEIFKNPHVQLALKLRNIVSQNNLIERGGYKNSPGALNLFEEFFKIIYSPETPLLMACLLETHFNEVRFYALKSMARSFHTKGKPYPAESLKNLLGFDSIEKVVNFVAHYEVDVINDNGEISVDLFNKEKLESKYKLNNIHEKPKLAQAYSQQLDLKINGRSLKDFINSGKTGSSFVQEPKFTPSSAAPIIPKSAQPNGVFGAMPNNDFGSTKASFDFKPQQAATTTSNFTFGSNNTAKQPLPVETTTASSTFQFQEAPKPKFPNTVPPSVQHKKIQDKPLKNTPSFLPPAQKETTASKSFSFPIQNLFGTSENKPSTEQTLAQITPKIEEIKGNNSPTPIISTPSAPTPIVPKKKKLTDSSHFINAAQLIIEELVSNTVQAEVKSLIPRLVQYHEAKHAKTKTIGALASELYDAFLSEIIYKRTLEIKADKLYQTNLKTRAIKLLKHTGTLSIERQQLKRKKRDELNSISFKKPLGKRKLSIADTSMSNTSMTKKRHFGTSVSPSPSINERQREIEKLWSPLNLQEFLGSCSKKLKVEIDSKDIEMDLLLVVENWSAPYSKWLNTKLSLQTNIEKRIYENSIKDNKMTLKIKSLPGNDYLSKSFFSETGFILFECGLTNEDSRYPTIQSKLGKDSKILSKIVSLVNKFTHYKVQILILFWDVKQSRLSDDAISSALSLKDLSSNENISNVVLCDMTNEDSNINDVLVNGFDHLSERFSGDLSKRGLKKKEKLLRIRVLNDKKSQQSAKNHVTNETFKANETSLLSKAKRSQKYDYLNNHIANSSSFVGSKGPNSSFKGINTSSDTSQYTVAHNRSIIPHLTSIHRNNSFLSNFNSTASSINNVSTLTGFGRGVIEESTPSSSPGRSKLSDIKKPLPKSVQQLRDLTAGIKARYKK